MGHFQYGQVTVSVGLRRYDDQGRPWRRIFGHDQDNASSW